MCYAPELHFLKLQARSIARHLDNGDINRIRVVLNDDDCRPAARYFERNISGEYGALRSKVVLTTRGDVCPSLPPGSGWRTQQVLKYRVAQRVEADACLILDAKNHFIRCVSQNSFFDDHVRFRSCLSTPRGGALERNFRASFAYFGLDPEKYLDRSPPAVTPFGVRTSRIIELLQMVEKRERDTFENFFMRRGNRIAEIFLMHAMILANAGTLESDFALGRRIHATMWPNRPDSGLAHVARTLVSGDIVSFAIHRRVLGRLRESQIRQLESIWRHAGLITDEADLAFFSRPFDECLLPR